ncbi:alpha-1,6-mannosyltransferase [Nakamurella panacisegetis]|uniref:Alpha-1,6-mannosyltransferase n=1 Tax=Nakamurella panacisegetis TaxID=1090615 RepID=A0A1H0SGC9_9ACTN|nr:polyprenol phosphomannose-dependent alpha 1,6 mannosyltransferase MptB [Nakamurella panacisegetis]SDP40842.1 alpha-1,6-mannosyltransferase [Nakamurella panacisegetis]
MTNGGASGAADRLPGVLDSVERRQLSRLRRWGTAGALLMMVGSTSSYGAATPIPNPVDGLRIVGLLSRIAAPTLALSYSGIGLVVVCWFMIGRLAAPGRARRLSRTQLTHTLAMWTVPFLVTPPIFSRDVYSYLAVGAMMVHGDNPYQSGPYPALGDSNPLAHQVDLRWQYTSSPYGPAFLLIAKAVVLVTGNHVVLGVLIQRFVELIGVALIVWALPRLARRCGIDPVSALWLGALNPLLLFHLVAGGHNEALMIGLMLAGLQIGLAVKDGTPRWWSADSARIAAGTALITLAAGIKVTAAMALAFLVIALARRAGNRWSDLFRFTVRAGAVAAATFAGLTVAAGAGLGWVHALSAPGSVQSFLSLSTSLAVGAGQLGLLLGLGDHTQGAIDVMQPLGTVVGGLLAVYLMWRCWQRRIEPMQGLALGLGAFVLLSPVIQPWYLLWAVLPLAASTGLSRYRRIAVWLTTIFSVIIMPNGATIPVFTIVQAVIVAAVVAGAVLLLLRRTGLPTAEPRPGGLLHPVTSTPARTITAAVIGIPSDSADTTASADDPYHRET